MFCAAVGYRWIVKDPETGWSWSAFANPADIDRRGGPEELRYANRLYRLRNTGFARVDYVLGEIYWKCSLGETVTVADYAAGTRVLSREADAEEVNYSHSEPLSWPRLATAFGLPVTGSGSKGIPRGTSVFTAGGCITTVVILVLLVLVILALSNAFSSIRTGNTIFIGGGSSYRGSGSYSGGK